MYKIGQILIGQIKVARHNGYDIEIFPDGQRGFLNSSKSWAVGSSIEVVFVAEHDGEMIFSPHASQVDKTFGQWQDESENPQIIQAYLEKVAERSKQSIEAVKAQTFVRNLEKSTAAQTTFDVRQLTGTFDENLLEILKAWKGLSDEEALNASASQGAGGINAYLKNAGLLKPSDCDSIQEGRELVERGLIVFPQFAVAFIDELTQGVPFADSLRIREWLPAAVS